MRFILCICAIRFTGTYTDGFSGTPNFILGVIFASLIAAVVSDCREAFGKK